MAYQHLTRLKAGLTINLIEALSEIVLHVPSYLTTVQERVIDELSLILSGHNFMTPGEGRYFSRKKGQRSVESSEPTLSSIQSAHIFQNGYTMTASRDHDVVLLALRTLESFNFEALSLLPFVQDCVSPYLDHEMPAIRKQAAVTCSRLLLPPVENSKSRIDNLRFRGPTAMIVSNVIKHLLVVGVADCDAEIRKTVIASFDSRFEPYLCQAHHLRPLFVVLNDEVFEIREVAVMLIGRLSVQNPAYIMPALRKTVIHILTELRFSDDARIKEESTKLLGHVVRACRRLTRPYLEPILDVLLPMLQSGNASLASAVLVTVGELAIVTGREMVEHEEKLLPLIIDTLQDHSSVIKREVAMRTLGQLVGSTGSVVRPYTRFPGLLEICLDMLHHGAGSPWSLRREVLKTLGILGALDPYHHKMCQLRLEKTGARKDHVVATDTNSRQSPGRQNLQSSFDVTTTGVIAFDAQPIAHIKEHPPSDQLTPSSEDYYPTVAITALMRILRDPTLSSHHNGVIQAVMFIFKSLGLRCVPFLSQILPPFLQVMQNCEYGLRESLIQQLANLVSIVKQHLREFLGGIFQLVKDYWEPHLEQILCLIEEISVALPDDIKSYMAELMPLLLGALSSRSPELKAHRLKLKVLHAVVMFGSAVEGYAYLLIPAIIQVLEENPHDKSHEGMILKAGALEAIGRLSESLDCFSDYASRIVHPVLRVISSTSDVKLLQVAVHVLCALTFHMQRDFLIFETIFRKAIESRSTFFRGNLGIAQYKSMVATLQRIEMNVRDPGIVSQPRFEYLTPGAPGTTTNDSLQNADGTSIYSFLGSVLPDRQLNSASAPIPDELVSGKTTLHVNQQNLRRAWEASQRSTKEDWVEWMRRFSVELLRESPSPALRSCSALAQVYHPLARELFNAAFVSCWTELYEQYQDYLVRALETAFQSDSIPPEILQTLLNLAEFMEHDVEALPIDIRQLGELAEKCHAYAKALHYKELEFHTSPSTCIEALISINNQLGQPEAAVGILKYARQHHGNVIEVKESWFEKLQSWSEALELYNAKQLEEPSNVQVTLGRMRCLEAMGDWEELGRISHQVWNSLCDDGVGALPNGALIPQSSSQTGLSSSSLQYNIRQDVAMLGARASWSLGDWRSMAKYVDATDSSSTQVLLYRAILATYSNDFELSELLVDETRRSLDINLAALVGESYNRAYNTMVVVQQLAELEEIIHYKRLSKDVRNTEERSRYRRHLMIMWKNRLSGCKRGVEIWQHLLAVRSLIISPHEILTHGYSFLVCAGNQETCLYP